MTWYMGLDANNKPNGWDTKPWGDVFEVSQEIRSIHEAHPDYIWNGTTLIELVLPPPPEPEPYIPQQVTMRQARLILLQYNLLDAIEAQMLTFPRAAQIEWEYAAVVDRSNPLLGMVGMTEEQLDQMFVEASQL